MLASANILRHAPFSEASTIRHTVPTARSSAMRPLCSLQDAPSCGRRVCFFAHSLEELRNLEVTARGYAGGHACVSAHPRGTLDCDCGADCIAGQRCSLVVGAVTTRALTACFHPGASLQGGLLVAPQAGTAAGKCLHPLDTPNACCWRALHAADGLVLCMCCLGPIKHCHSCPDPPLPPSSRLADGSALPSPPAKAHPIGATSTFGDLPGMLPAQLSTVAAAAAAAAAAAVATSAAAKRAPDAAGGLAHTLPSTASATAELASLLAATSTPLHSRLGLRSHSVGLTDAMVGPLLAAAPMRGEWGHVERGGGFWRGSAGGSACGLAFGRQPARPHALGLRASARWVRNAHAPRLTSACPAHAPPPSLPVPAQSPLLTWTPWMAWTPPCCSPPLLVAWTWQPALHHPWQR